MSKTFTLKTPTKPASADTWVSGQTESKKPIRFTVEIDEALHRRMKVACVIEGITMADLVRRMLNEKFPV